MPRHEEGELHEVARGAAKQFTAEQLASRWTRCLAVAANQGWNFRRACGMFIGETGRKPWECGLPNLPGRGGWDQLVAEVLPQFVRRKYAVES
jgi:hypothetical protein